MPPSNRASYIPSSRSPTSTIAPAPYTSPSTNELVIATRAIAINPADVAIQSLGVLISHYPAILGCDVAGQVVEVHSSLAGRFDVGDRVAGAANCVKRNDDGVYCYSGFQEYVVLSLPSIAKIPEHVGFEDAVVLPLGLNTAASCLFGGETLGLELPGSENAGDDVGGRKKTLLIWGASSSVGCCGVQLAKHAGYEVVGIASERNHEMVRSAGASMCFDQRYGGLVEGVVAYLEGREVVGAYVAITDDEALRLTCEILEKSGGRKVVASIMPGAEEKASKGVEIRTNFAVDMTGGGVCKAVWEWLGQAMGKGVVKYLPPPEVVGKGLEQVQYAVDLWAKGVSAKKLVVSM